jgi:hypothetical protein
MSKQNPTRPFKGLQTDTSPLDQPKGSYTMAWNAVNETSDGNNNFISNEQSNELCGQITPGYRPIGDVYISDENTVIFSTDGTNSEIGILDFDCNYTVIVNNTCLNFQITDQIDAVFRVRRGCERTIYFTDGVNSVRYFNLDKPDEFKDQFGAWDCKLFELFLDFKNPCFSNFEILEQGSLRPGVYAFALQYLDKDLNPTKWTHITLPIPIYNYNIESRYEEIIGSAHIDVDSLGGSGDTNKAIKLILSNLDTTYTFYRIAVISYTSFVGIATKVVVSFENPITQTEFTYSGNDQGYTEGDINEIRIQPAVIETAKHIEQLENRLILAELKGKQVDFCSFQQFASPIKAKYVKSSAPANKIGTGNSKTPDTYWFERGYMGDEVYAFGIVYVFEDGFESPAYHIPGIDSTYYDLNGCGTPCSTGTQTQNCLRVREDAPQGGTCVGLLTSYTVNFTVDGVPNSVNHTIISESAVRGWVDIYCGPGLIGDIEVIVDNNNCTANIAAFPLYEYIATADIPPADVGFWWTIYCPGGLTAPFSPIGISFREKQITTCVGGLPVSPGAGWVLALDDCAGTNTATYVREPLWNETVSCTPPSNDNDSVWADTNCVGAGCIPDIPTTNGIGQSWYLLTTGFGPAGSISFWIDINSILPDGIQVLQTTITFPNCPLDIIDLWEENIAHIYPDSAAYNALPANEKLKNWQIYNTAAPISNDEGFMAYWESSSSEYTTILDCNGNDYWGNDFCGNPLVGQKVRHHKFPDRNLIPHYNGVNVSGAYESILEITLQYNGTEVQLAALLNPNEELLIDYDLDGVAQSQISVQIFFDEFIFDSVTSTFDPLVKVIITREGDGTSGIDNVTFSGVVGLDANMVITNTSIINNEEVAPKTNQEVVNLGIKFENIVYPHPDIIGHYIVRGERDQFNRTVVEKGITNSTHESTGAGLNYNIFSYFSGGPTNLSGQIYNQSRNYNFLLTPKLLFKSEPANGSYIKQETQFQYVWTDRYGNKDTGVEFDNLTEFGAGEGKSAVFDFDGAYAVISDTRRLYYSGTKVNPTPPIKIRTIKKSVMLNGLTYDDDFINGRKLYNVSHTNRVQMLEIDYPGMHSETTRDIPYASVKVDRDIHPNLFSIQYYRTHNCVLSNSQVNRIFGGDTFIAPFNLSNSSYYKFQDSIWDTVFWIWLISSLVFVTIYTGGAAAPAIAAAISKIAAGVTAAAVTTTIVVGAIVAGAIGITAHLVEEITLAYRSQGLGDLMVEDNEMEGASETTKRAMRYVHEYLKDIYVESEINMGLRHDHTIYQYGDFYKETFDIRAYFRDKLMIFNEEAGAKKDQWAHRGIMLPEVYHYNFDYSVINKENVYTNLPESYDCCSDCLESFPTRVTYSEQSFQEEASDNYRVFLANNYRDIEAEKGTITNIFRKHNNLFIHTEEALWQLPQNIQERITGDLISYVGTGSYFSIPPRLINDDEIGSAGSRHKWATIKTDMGIFFIDESNRDVFMMTSNQGMKAISNNGMRNFFRQNLVPFLETQYKRLTGNKFLNVNNPANPNGVGYATVQDTRHERLMFTKRDYKILPDYTASFVEVESVATVITGIVADQLFFDITTRQFGIGTGVDTYNYILLGDPLYFENKSWTLSYSFLTNSWTSFHSYIPLYYYYIHNQFYSFVDNAVWKHNVLGSYQNFYGTRYPHIIEYISLSSPVMTRLWDELMLQTIARVYDIVTQEYIDKRFVTFNKAIFYNSRQTSGLLNLIVKDDTSEDYLVQQIMNIANNQIKINRDERNWTLNEIRDYRVDYDNSIWSKDWDSLKSEFPIDKVLNSSTIDFDKIWYDLQVLRDKYLIIRLIFDNFDDVNLITNYSFERETPSAR